MKSSHGVIQGYDGLANVDEKHQIVVHAEVYGEAQEHELLIPMIEGTRAHFDVLKKAKDIFKKAKLTADSGFHTEANMKYVYEQRMDGYLADKLFRKRDPRFSEVEKYKRRSREERRQRDGSKRLFKNTDFHYDPKAQTCRCPAGKKMYGNGNNIVINGYRVMRFHGQKTACRPCALRAQCLKHPERTEARQVAFFIGRDPQQAESYTAKMKRKIDSDYGKFIYSRRLGIVEPVFANIQNKGLRRFTLRGKPKVDTQWKLFCIVHNIEKIHHYGLGFT